MTKGEKSRLRDVEKSEYVKLNQTKVPFLQTEKDQISAISYGST